MAVIGHFIVDSGGVDNVFYGPPSFLGMGHNGDYVILTGPADYIIIVTHDFVEVVRHDISVAEDKLVKIMLEEGTERYPGNWDIHITVDSPRFGYSADDLLALKGKVISRLFLNDKELPVPAAPLPSWILPSASAFGLGLLLVSKKRSMKK